MLPESGYTRKNPFPAILTVNRRLTTEASGKETRHLEISISGSGLNYEVGDSVGVVPSNPPELVELIHAELGLAGTAEVPTPEG